MVDFKMDCPKSKLKELRKQQLSIIMIEKKMKFLKWDEIMFHAWYRNLVTEADLIDDKYPTALQNIDKAKSSQIKAQNNNRPVTQTVISTGSKVWISVMGLNEKLHPKYRGPFTVLGQTKNGNYIVEDVFKQKLSNTFPLQRLKLDISRLLLTGGKDEAIFEVEKIINHRLNKNKKYEFL
ncbi:hypothetical protein BpHYR1_033326, partial [Brachionus plicatilis]